MKGSGGELRKRERGGGGRGREGEMGENWGRQAGERKGQLRTTEEGGKAKSTEEGGKTGNTEFGKSPPPPHPINPRHSPKKMPRTRALPEN